MREQWPYVLCGVVIALFVGVVAGIATSTMESSKTTAVVACPKCEALTELLAEQRASYNVEREKLRAQIVGMVNQHTAQLKKIEDLLFKEATNGDQKRAAGTQAARQGN